MELTCFQSLIQVFNPRLNVDGTIECAIRGVPLVIRPEELVRQSLLCFLISQYNVLSEEKICIKVEYENMDIAIYMKPLNSNFSPDLPPILIIETKNKYVHPLDSDTNERQIKNYLRLKGCGVGILFNCDSGFIYEFSNDSFSKVNLVDLCEIVIIIKKEYDKQEQIILEQSTDFHCARQGDFESFKRLIEQYGKNANSTIRFVYEQNKLPVRVAAFLFKVDGDVIYFRNRGLYTRKREPVSIRDFRQLLSIERLT